MGTKNFSNANDLITFSRASGGTALRKVAYGSELISNGEFTSDTSGWAALGATQAIVSGELEITTTNAGGGSWQLISVTPNKPHLLTLDRRVGTADIASVIVYDGGIPGSGAPSLINDTDAGTFSEAFVPTNDTVSVYLRAAALSAGTTAYYDNISVKEVLFDQGTLTLFNHPADIPRIEYDADGNVLGLLVEESRTNLITYSEDFSNAVWSKGSGYNSTISTDQTVSPSGLIDADALVSDSAGGSGSVMTARPVSVTSGTSYTLSIYAKGNTLSWMQLYLLGYTSPGNGGAYFDLQNGEVGTVTSGYTAQIADIGNGWYRCSLSFTAGASVSGEMRVLLADSDNDSSVARDGVTSIYIWGAQLEAGAFPTSYIPTNGATATRSADVASIPVADFGYNQSEGTMVVEGDGRGTFGRIAVLNDGSNSNLHSINFESTYARSYGVSSGSVQYNFNISSWTTGDSIRAAVSFSENDFAASAGGSLLTDSSGDLPININKIQIGSLPNLTYPLNGHIKKLMYIPRRVTNAQLQSLTE